MECKNKLFTSEYMSGLQTEPPAVRISHERFLFRRGDKDYNTAEVHVITHVFFPGLCWDGTAGSVLHSLSLPFQHRLFNGEVEEKNKTKKTPEEVKGRWEEATPRLI